MDHPRTAEELNLFDYEVPEGMSISVQPPAREYMEDPVWYDSGGRNPFHRQRVHRMSAGEARKRKLSEIVRDFPRHGQKMCEWAVDQNDPDLLKELLAVGASLNIAEAKRRDSASKGGSGQVADDEHDPYPIVDMQPALHVAAFEGKFECVKVLVEDGSVDVNSKDENDSTALANALTNSHEDVVDWLLEHGAHITFERHNINDLQAALRSSKVALVDKVLRHPQSVERNLRIETSHLPYAAYSRGDPSDMVRFVLRCDCFTPPVTQLQKDITAESLRFAVSVASIETVRLVLQFLTRQDEHGSFGYVELSQAVQSSVSNATEDAMGKQDIPELFELVWDTLLCNSAACTDPENQPPVIREVLLNRRLISACAEGCMETCRLLAEKHGADIHHVSHEIFSTPLGRATGSTAKSLHRRMPVARYLLEERYVNIHLADGKYANSATPLATILKMGHRGQDEMIKLLLKNGGPLEDIDDDVLSEVLAKTEQRASVRFYLVLHEAPRDPVRLMTREQLDRDSAESRRIFTEVNARKEEWEAWLRTMQVRESNEELATKDRKNRPLG